MRIEELLAFLVEVEGSDLILKPGSPPAAKVHGQLRFIGDEPVEEAFNRGLFEKHATAHAKKRLEADQETDVALEFADVGRFRANVFFQRGKLSIVMRRILTHIGTFEHLNLPAKGLESMARSPRGLVLVTGVAGSGKSTTLAAIIEHINLNHGCHIITIEDPIEFIYRDNRSMIQQRELGLDTETFAGALKHIVRQSPDVILIGEMRDKETMEAALSAAETGHLVFSTLHTVNATQTVERIISFFPPHQHGLIRLQLSLLLQGVISLRLVPRKDGKGRVPAAEILASSPTVRQLLAEGKTYDLVKALEEGEFYGMQSFNRSLTGFLRAGTISLEDALIAADDPDALRLEVRGIRKGI